MLRSAKSAYFSGQFVEKPSFEMIYNRFRSIHKYIKDSDFKGDGNNNLVILDYNSPTEVTSENFIGHFIYGIDSAHVDTVISNGEIIVKDKEIVKVNEEEILNNAKACGLKLWEKMKNNM
jgi:hypothetical protein